MRRYVFFFLIKGGKLEALRNTVARHTDYWHNRKVDKIEAGPFADRTGGMILFYAENWGIANELALNDPFVLNEIVENMWLKEWEVKEIV